MTSTTWYRRSVWNYKGVREYTKAGYDYAFPKFVAEDLDVDCTDRHFMITGCTSGIGLEIAMEVAKRGGVLHMVCRNKDTARATRSDIITTTGNDKIYLHVVDLTKPVELAYWAKRFASKHEKLHLLIHNADVFHPDRKFDDYGIEANFAVNVLAAHILNVTMLPILQKNEDARVVTIGSSGMLLVRLDPIDIMHEKFEPFDAKLVYAQNKRQMATMSLWFAQRWENVHFSCMNPGWADTTSVRNSLPDSNTDPMKDNLRSASEAADTAVWLALSKAALAFPSGLFFQDREPVPTHLSLAWTKSSIAEDDLLMKNIGDIYATVESHLPGATEEQEKVEVPQAQQEVEKEIVEQEIAATEAAPVEAEVEKEIKEPEEQEPAEEELPSEPVITKELPAEPEPIEPSASEEPSEEPQIPAEPEPIIAEEPEVPAEIEPIAPEEPKLPAEPEPIKTEEPELPAEPEPIKTEEPELPAEPEPIKTEEPELPAEPEPIKTEEPELPAEPKPIKIEEPELPAEPEPIEPIPEMLAKLPAKSELPAEPIVPLKPMVPAEPVVFEKPIMSQEPIAPRKPKVIAEPTEQFAPVKPKVLYEPSPRIALSKPTMTSETTPSAKPIIPAEPVRRSKVTPVAADLEEEVVVAKVKFTAELISPGKPKVSMIPSTHTMAQKLEKPKTLPMEE